MAEPWAVPTEEDFQRRCRRDIAELALGQDANLGPLRTEDQPHTVGCTNPQCRVVEYLPRGGPFDCCPSCYNRSPS